MFLNLIHQKNDLNNPHAFFYFDLFKGIQLTPDSIESGDSQYGEHYRLASNFQFTIKVLLTAPKDFRVSLGKDARLYFLPNQNFIHGIVNTIQGPAEERGGFLYTFTLMSSLGLLKYQYYSRVFYQVDIRDIVQALIDSHNELGGPIIKIRFNLYKSHPIVTQWAQHEQNTLDFLHLSLFHFGVSYYFEHSKSSSTIVFIDSFSFYPKINPENIDYTDLAGAKDNLA